MEINGEHDGHVNRNIRIALALMDMSRPHIEIVSIKEVNESTTRLTWKVNGCHTIDEARLYYYLTTSPHE